MRAPGIITMPVASRFCRIFGLRTSSVSWRIVQVSESTLPCQSSLCCYWHNNQSLTRDSEYERRRLHYHGYVTEQNVKQLGVSQQMQPGLLASKQCCGKRDWREDYPVTGGGHGNSWKRLTRYLSRNVDTSLYLAFAPPARSFFPVSSDN